MIQLLLWSFLSGFLLGVLDAIYKSAEWARFRTTHEQSSI